jgi:hypothetical protein
MHASANVPAPPRAGPGHVQGQAAMVTRPCPQPASPRLYSAASIDPFVDPTLLVGHAEINATAHARLGARARTIIVMLAAGPAGRASLYIHRRGRAHGGGRRQGQWAEETTSG